MQRKRGPQIGKHLSAFESAITETWLSPNVPIDISGYSLLRHDRSDGRRGGGVCVFVKDMLPFIHLKDIESHEYESLWLF